MSVESELKDLLAVATRVRATTSDEDLREALDEICEEIAAILQDIRTLPVHRLERLDTSVGYELGLLPRLEQVILDDPLDPVALEELRRKSLRSMRRYVQDQ